MPSLGATFGRGAATTAQWDLANSDCVVIMGSNMAENHPIAFRFVLEAKERGATIIHVDPRFTRTSAMADIYAPIRAGSDIAFLGGLIRHILENDLWFKEYALHYTNIAHIIDEQYQDAEDLDGLFSGWDDKGHAYQSDSWQYEHQTPSHQGEHHPEVESHLARGKAGHGPPPTDPTLQDPRCVYQILRRHYARYTPEMVERITGCPRDTFLKIAEAITRNSGRERTGAWCYAVGWTASHHRRPDDPGRGDYSDVAGKHWPPRWWNPRPPRPHQYPGQHGRSDALQPSARVSASASFIPTSAVISGLCKCRNGTDRLVVELSEVHRQPAKSVVRRARHG